MALYDRLPFFFLSLPVLLTVFATAFTYFLIQLWRVRNFFKELQNRGLVNHPVHHSNRWQNSSDGWVITADACSQHDLGSSTHGETNHR